MAWGREVSVKTHICRKYALESEIGAESNERVQLVDILLRLIGGRRIWSGVQKRKAQLF